MTAQERLVAVAKGETPDKAPTIGLSSASDAMIVLPKNVGATGRAELGLVMSPLARAMNRGIDVLKKLSDDPIRGADVLESLENETRLEIATALKGGAAGVFYFLDGAYPTTTTPMQYGGHFLELDRRLLQVFCHAAFNVLYVNGESEPYIDFVSDLPASGFAWDRDSGITNQEVRSMRQGALMGSEFLLETTARSLEETLTEKVVC